MNADWLADYLGDFYADTTGEQRERIARAGEQIESRYPVPEDGTPQDVEDEREAALSAAVQIILGDATLEDRLDAYQRAHRAAMAAHAAQTGALIAEAQEVTKATLHRRTGLARATIDKALG